MSDYVLHKRLLTYVDTATNLAESIKRNIMKRKKDVAIIDDKTVAALNEFMKAANDMADFREVLIKKTIDYN